MFRHTAASLINKETGNMKLSQAQLGHANVQITADVYKHVDEFPTFLRGLSFDPDACALVNEATPRGVPCGSESK
jgi:hypothetical protein